MSDRPLVSKQVNRLKHIVEVVRRFPHAHEHHLLHRTPQSRQHHLRNDFGAAQLPQQATLSGHAEQATDGTADLRRHANTITRQQHALDHLSIGQADQQTRRAILSRMHGVLSSQLLKFGGQTWQGAA